MSPLSCALSEPGKYILSKHSHGFEGKKATDKRKKSNNYLANAKNNSNFHFHAIPPPELAQY